MAHILVVDDDKDLCTLLKQLWNGTGTRCPPISGETRWIRRPAAGQIVFCWMS